MEIYPRKNTTSFYTGFILFISALTDFEFLIFVVALSNKKTARVQFTENIVFYINFHMLCSSFYFKCLKIFSNVFINKSRLIIKKILRKLPYRQKMIP